MKNFLYLVLGALFGILLYKGELASIHKIRNMFHFKEPDLFLVIFSAIAVGALGLQLLKVLETNHKIPKQVYPTKTFTKGTILGGFLFGMGWYLTGACPGPIAVQIGSGAWPALFTILGALLGTYIYAVLKPKLPH